MDAAELLAAKSLREVVVRVPVGDDHADLRFRSIPRPDYRRLLDEHPPVDEADNWNEDTFPPALIAACAVEPPFTLDEATELWNTWDAGDAGQVFMAVWALNERSSVGFISPGSAPTGGSGPNSNTASR